MSRHRRIRVRVLNPMRRRRSKSRRRRNPAFMNPRRSRRSRSHTKWGRIKAHKRRVNPMFKSRRRRRNPPRIGQIAKNVFSVKNIVRYLTIGGGFVVGQQVTGFLDSGRFFGMGPAVPPAWTETIRPARPAFGAVQMLLGGLFAAKAKQAVMKDAALGIAVSGGVDIFNQIIGMLMPATIAPAQGSGSSSLPASMMGSGSSSLPASMMGSDFMSSRTFGSSSMLDTESSMG